MIASGLRAHCRRDLVLGDSMQHHMRKRYSIVNTVTEKPSMIRK